MEQNKIPSGQNETNVQNETNIQNDVSVSANAGGGNRVENQIGSDSVVPILAEPSQSALSPVNSLVPDQLLADAALPQVEETCSNTTNRPIRKSKPPTRFKDFVFD